jgi:hypothetical protein
MTSLIAASVGIYGEVIFVISNFLFCIRKQEHPAIAASIPLYRFVALIAPIIPNSSPTSRARIFQPSDLIETVDMIKSSPPFTKIIRLSLAYLNSFAAYPTSFSKRAICIAIRAGDGFTAKRSAAFHALR